MTRHADVLQYGSRASYGTAIFGCDTNAARFATEADMQAWLTGGNTDVEYSGWSQASKNAMARDIRDEIINGGAPPFDGTVAQILNDIRNRVLAGFAVVARDDASLLAAIKAAATDADAQAILEAIAALPPATGGPPPSYTGTVRLDPVPPAPIP